MNLMKGLFKIAKKACALVLVLSMVSTSLIYAEGTNDNSKENDTKITEEKSSTENAVNEANDAEDKADKSEDKKEEVKEKQEEEKNENQNEEKKEEEKKDSEEKVDDKKEDSQDDKKDEEKKSDDKEDEAAEDNISQNVATQSEAKEEDKADDTEDADATTEKVVATKSETDFVEDTEAKETIATQSEAKLMGDGETYTTYFVSYHYVMPNNNNNSATLRWTNLFDGRTESRKPIERYYYVEDVYDETEGNMSYSSKYYTGQSGILNSYHTYDIVCGYNLIGWNTDEEAAKNGIAQYGISPAKEAPLTTEKNKRINLYSVFEAIPMTVEFDINDNRKGTGSTRASVDTLPTKQVYYGDSLSFIEDDVYTSKTITRPGYDLLGWSFYTYLSLYKNIDPNNEYYISDGVAEDTTIIKAESEFDKSFLPSSWNGADKVIKPGMTIKFYAVWQPKVYKVKVHYPSFAEGRVPTFAEAVEECKKAPAEDALMVFDNDLEAVQSFNTARGCSNPLRSITASRIPTTYFAGLGDDPNCIDTSKVKITRETYWFDLVSEGTVPDLYFILTEDIYANSVRIKVDLDGGTHRLWSTYDLRQPVGTSYRDMFYTGLVSNLQKEGYVLDKIVKVNADGSDGEEFNPDQVVKVSDKPAEAIQNMKDYDAMLVEIEPYLQAYNDIKRESSERYKAAREDKEGYDVAINRPEFLEFVERYQKVEKEFNEKYSLLCQKELQIIRYFDVFLRCKWKGKTIKGLFDYGGNRTLPNKVEGQTATEKSVTYGQAIGSLPKPTSKGYNFKGWKTGRGLGAHEYWKNVDENTIFDKAETVEAPLLQMNYDEREFTFYADWEPITLSVGVTQNEYAEAKVTLNEFKFGEPTILDIKGEWTVTDADEDKTKGLFGGTSKVKEAYGIEILSDYYSDKNSSNALQTVGAKYYNGDSVTLYMNQGETLNIRPIWRDKQATPAPAPTPVTPTPTAPINNNNKSNNNNSSSSSSSSSRGSSIGIVSNNGARAVVQQTLQQTMSSGKFEKAVVNTANLSIKTVNSTNSTWMADKDTGKWRLSGVNAFGQLTVPSNCFCQVKTVLKENAANLKAGDTVTDTYYFDAAGNMVTGWMKTSDNKWYFFSDQKDGNEGKMALGWTQVAGNWYYFTSNGSMLVNGTAPDGLKVDANGVWKK